MVDVVVSYDRVIVDELEVSEAVPHPGGMCKVHVIQTHPTFLVETPWFVIRFDLLTAKPSSLKVYLDPPGKVVQSWCTFVKNLERSVKEKLSGVTRSGITHQSIVEEGVSGGRYMTIRIPSSELVYRCFDSTSGKDIPCDLSEIRKGMMVRFILDMSEVWVDNKKWGFTPRLFQAQVRGCPQTGFLKAAGPPRSQPLPPAGGTSSSSKSSGAVAAAAKPVSNKKFIPSLEDIIRRKNELKGKD